MSFAKYPSNATVETIRRERQRDIITIEQIQTGKLPGRYVNRTPASPSDVISGDALGDINVTATHLYRLVDVPSTGLRWHRQSLDVSW